MSHIGWGGKQTTIYEGMETFPSQTCFKALWGSPKGKAQRGQYLLAVDLGRYKWYQSQTSYDVPAFSLWETLAHFIKAWRRSCWTQPPLWETLGPKGGGFGGGPVEHNPLWERLAQDAGKEWISKDAGSHRWIDSHRTLERSGLVDAGSHRWIWGPSYFILDDK